MKAITVRAHWGMSILAGAKTIETRPRNTRYRGPLAIHHSTHEGAFWDIWHQGHQQGYGAASKIVDAIERLPVDFTGLGIDDWFGSIAGSVQLVECVPILAEPVRVDDAGLVRGSVVLDETRARACYYRPGIDPTETCLDVSDQIPFGDFTPGRWALILTDPALVMDRCPYCWGRGFHPVAALRLNLFDERPITVGEIKGVTEIAAARHRKINPCPACDGLDHLPGPVAARGQVTVPWNWNP